MKFKQIEAPPFEPNLSPNLSNDGRGAPIDEFHLQFVPKQKVKPNSIWADRHPRHDGDYAAYNSKGQYMFDYRFSNKEAEKELVENLKRFDLI